MYKIFEQRLAQITNSNQSHLLKYGKKGVEKESLRVTADGRIAQTAHPPVLGATLTNPAITTDFSEALLELITPPFAHIEETLQYLQHIHQFVYHGLTQAGLEEEVLWAVSMPCIISGDKSIPIAQYGASNVGMMKHIYRRGLDHRYGRAMQAISGVHFNYSVNEDLWPIFQEQEAKRLGQSEQDIQAFISACYFALARNVLRYEWLLTYLFGCSPALCKSFLGEKKAAFDEFDASTYYAPHATSLRMSDIGYKNKSQTGLHIPYNNLDAYVTALANAVETPYPDYEALGVVVDGEYRQLNGNILQIANEYYSSIRPKQVTRSGERPTSALKHRGVQYVELRMLDVDPFSPSGVNIDHARFLEAFLLFCLLQESPEISQQEQQEIDGNQHLVSTQGRRADLMLQRNGQAYRLQNWASEVLEQIKPICRLLDEGQSAKHYTSVLEQQMDVVLDAEQTPSARFMAEMRASGASFYEYGLHLSEQYKRFFNTTPLNEEAMDYFTHMAKVSIEKQAEIEESDELSFEEYLAKYFAQS